MGKVIAIGIDGAPWELVDRFRAKGLLPHIDRLIREGVSGDLRSSIPPVTSPAWKCYSTGKNPGKLGAFWWTRVDFAEKRLSFVSSKDFKSKDYWDYIAEANGFVVQINQPMTYPPPKEFNGIFVSGVPAMENDDYTCPPDLKAELVSDFGYRIAPEVELEQNPARFIKGVHKLVDNRFDVAERYVDRADLVQVSIFFIDDVQHFMWGQMKGGMGAFKDSIEELWIHIDQRIGGLVDRAGPESHTVIFSDHGFTDLKGALYVNEYLGEDYIQRKSEVRMGKRTKTERLVTLAGRLHLTPLLKRLASKERLRQLQRQTLEAELDRRSFFDWDATRVYCSGEGPVYINRGLVKNDEEYEALRTELKERLEGLVHPETGERVVDRVYRREEVYHGPHLGKAPDMIILPRLGYEIVANVTPEGDVWSTGGLHHNEWMGVHRMEGILILSGPEVREGARIEGADIIDLAPTVLALMRFPVPTDMDGKVLVDAMKEPDMYRDVERMEGEAKEEDDHEFTEEEEERLQKRLEALGYM
jgi:predicted AlkP superfamily phosphohydrolase/phosphomutase